MLDSLLVIIKISTTSEMDSSEQVVRDSAMNDESEHASSNNPSAEEDKQSSVEAPSQHPSQQHPESSSGSGSQQSNQLESSSGSQQPNPPMAPSVLVTFCEELCRFESNIEVISYRTGRNVRDDQNLRRPIDFFTPQKGGFVENRQAMELFTSREYATILVLFVRKVNKLTVGL
jgi:hypothetical protein